MKIQHAFSGVAVILLTAGSLAPLAVLADDAPSLALEPHCNEKNRSLCALYNVVDDMHLTTVAVTTGDILDIDVTLTNGGNKGIKTIRSWL